MTIRARQRAVQARKIAAHLTVVEARWRKRPLIVALAATRRERIGMNVILSVAVDAQVSRAGEPLIAYVAAIAALLIVSSL